MQDITTLYRYESLDIRDYEDSPPTPRIRCDEYFVISRTPKGVRIKTGDVEFNGKAWLAKTKWVSLHSKKRYAYPTKAEAWEAFKHRTRRRMEILMYQLKYTQTLMAEIQLKRPKMTSVECHRILMGNDESREGVKMGLSGW